MNRQGQLAHFFATSAKVAHVRLTKVDGSAPRDAGTEMFVAQDAVFGTIGGGRLEQMIIEQARTLLEQGDISGFMDVPLGPEIGQCCGGRVQAQLTRMSQRDREAALNAQQQALSELPCVYIMGAGHVGRALAAFFALLPVQTILIDSRADQLAMCAAPVDQRHRAMPEVDISNAPPGSTFIVVTHDHALDFLLASAALQRGDAAYVGLIGSMSKRAKFKSWCSTNCDNLSMDGLICPIGGTTSSDKRPAVIAAFVAAEVMAKLTTSQHAQPVKSHDAIVAFNKAEHVSPGSKSSGAGL